MEKITLIATTAFGLEAVVAREVRNLGYSDVQVENGKVTFQADVSAMARANLWLRSAERVRLKIGEFTAVTFAELFEKTKDLPWAEWIPVDGEFPVEGKAVKSQLYSVPDCQAIVKKAVVESLKKKYKKQWFAENGPLYKIEVALLKDVATLTIDTSGSGLHKRGYREWLGQAPVRETLAAALIQLSYWNPERVLADPFCGSGTIPIEAALIGKNIAPGMERKFACENWPHLAPAFWREARAEARDVADFGRKLEIIGTDIDEQVLKIARRNVREANLTEDIHLQRMLFSQWCSSKKYGVVICNPPYGERLGERKEAEKLYQEMGRIFTEYETWSHYILTSHSEFEALYNRKADKNRKLFNGFIKVYYYQYFGPRPPKKAAEKVRQV